VEIINSTSFDGRWNFAAQSTSGCSYGLTLMPTQEGYPKQADSQQGQGRGLWNIFQRQSGEERLRHSEW
jgi:hypothetical protein